MVFPICVSAGNDYYISCSYNGIDSYTDRSVAFALKISHSQYKNILKKYGAMVIYGDCHFKNIENAKSAIEELESIIILNKLVGEV